MENGKSLLKFLGIVFLSIGFAGIVAGILLVLFVPSLWLFCIIFGGISGIFLIPGAICMTIYCVKKNKRNRLLSAGKYVYAEIVDIDVNIYQKVQIDRISMNPYFITCRYAGPDGREYIFKSKSLLYNPSGLIEQNRLKVYVDLAKPNKYYVDTSSILPDDAVLHKFKYDSSRNSERLMQGGQYIEAETCGVELIGRIKVNSMVRPMFLKMTDGMAAQSQFPTDEKNRTFVGYSVLCRYQAPDGRVHIFASKGQWGEPDRAYQGERVRVYYSGTDYKNYHVALR